MSAREVVARALDDPTLTMSYYATREGLRMARAGAALAALRAHLALAPRAKAPAVLTVEGAAIWALGERAAFEAMLKALGNE
jgi:hypothetical protein